MKVLVGIILAFMAVNATAGSMQVTSRNVDSYNYKNELTKKPEPKIGMSQDEVLNKTNCGIPIDILITSTAKENLEQWIYEGRKYLYFSNGKLIQIQQQ